MAANAENVGGRADNTPTETTYDRAALEDKLNAQMSAFGDSDETLDDEVVDDDSEVINEDVETEEEDDSQADQEVEETEESETDDEDDVAGEDDEEVVEEAADEPTAKGKTPTLPDSYRRSLAAHGWKPEEIDQNLELLGPKFVDMAAGVHAKRTAEIAQWAEVGRKAVSAEQAEEQVSQGPVINGVPQALQPIDLDKMKEEFGDAELLDRIITPINGTIAALNAVLPQIQQGVQSIQQTHVDATNAQIHKFFDAENMEPFRKFYGGSEHERSAEQLEHRREVVEKASYIMAGAQSMHRDITLEQALIEAHDATASDFREQAVRKSIKRQVKKRNRGISQKPSKRGSRVASSRSKTASERERKIGSMMAKAFGN